jgi:hypothetical protein
MNLMSKEDLIQLSTKKDGWHVSILMPTHRMGSEIQQDPIRLKNLAEQAEQEMMEAGARRPAAQEILAPARALIDDAEFWQHQSDSLAVFAAPDTFRLFRLPLDFEEKVVVGRRFYLKPLMPLLSYGGDFYILALSQQEVRLLRGTGHSVGEVDLEDVPMSLAEALRYDDPEARLGFRTDTSAPHARGEQHAVFYGSGAAADEDKEQLLRYFQQVSAGIDDLLAEERSPLVLAGVDYLLPIYRQANTYKHLTDAEITGNPEETSAAELHEQAWQIVEPIFAEVQHAAAERFPAAQAHDQASDELDEVVPAAHYGRVDTLFVTLDVEQWGTFAPETKELEIHTERDVGDEDLLDVIAVQTLLHGGTVFAVPAAELPGDGPVAALFRY